MIIEEVQYDDNTVLKVSSALKTLGVLTEQQIVDVIAEMQNRGILFRERIDRSRVELVGRAIDFTPAPRPSKFAPGGEFQPAPSTYIHWAYETKD